MKPLPLLAALGATVGLPVLAAAQIPDLLNSLEPGSPSLGAAGAFDVTNADTFSTYYNPAGLGYVSRRTLSAAYRNLPSSRSTVFGNFAAPGFRTDTDRGSNAFTHFGYAQPLKRGGSVGISYTTGGYIEDVRTGTGLAVGALTLNNYSERVAVRADFYTLAYGRALPKGGWSLGAGLVYARQRVEDAASGTLVDAANQPQPFSTTNVSDTGSGVGVLVGAQFTPPNAPNSSIGVSLRTPIGLAGNSDTSGLYDRIPGVIRLGYASRIDFAGRGDYLVYGAHVAHYYGADGGSILSRRAQTTLGLGVEYALRRGDATIPLRLGYLLVPSGGDSFDRRDAITLGVGYRPANARYGVDLGYALPRQGGGNDLSITATYRFDK